MFSICKSKSAKSSRRLLDLKPLKPSIEERTMTKAMPFSLCLSNFLPFYLRSAPQVCSGT